MLLMAFRNSRWPLEALLPRQDPPYPTVWVCMADNVRVQPAKIGAQVPGSLDFLCPAFDWR